MTQTPAIHLLNMATLKHTLCGIRLPNVKLRDQPVSTDPNQATCPVCVGKAASWATR